MKRGPHAKRRPSLLRDGPEAVARWHEQERREVAAMVRRGLSDAEGARTLHMEHERFRQLREALGLPANAPGGAL